MIWEKVKLGDVLDYEQPTKYIVKSENYNDSFSTPVLTAGKSFILGYTDEKEGVFSNFPVIIFDDFTTAIKFVDFPFKVKSSAMKILNPKKEVADIRFLYYLMLTIKTNSTEHKRYWISKYAEIEIQLPPLSIQQRIAAILDEADSLRQKDKALVVKHDELIQALFLDMFGDPIINSKKWNEITLKDIVINKKNAIVDGPFGASIKQVDYVEKGIPIIRINNIRNEGFYNNEFNYIRKEKYEELIRSKVVKNDILLARVGNTIGKVCVFDQTFEALLSTTGVAKVSIDFSKFNLHFIIKMLSLPNYKKHILSFVQGAGQPYLNLTQIKSFKVIDVPFNLQNQFAERVEIIEEQKRLLQTSLLKSEELFNSLLQKAFKGELV